MEAAIAVTTMAMLRTKLKPVIVIDKEVEGIGAHNRINVPLSYNSNSTTIIVVIEYSLVRTIPVVEETIGITSMGIKGQWEMLVNHNSNNARATKETTISTITSAAQRSTSSKMMAV